MRESSQRAARGAERDWRSLLTSVERAVVWSAAASSFDAEAPDVSAWSVGRQLEHLLLSDRRILAWLETAADEGGAEGHGRGREGRGGPTWVGWLVLTTGFIPRGRGQAPEFTLPAGLPRSEVETAFRDIQRRLAALEPRLAALAASRATLPHPSLGAFTAGRWLRFARVHHAHHEKIIRGILRAAGRLSHERASSTASGRCQPPSSAIRSSASAGPHDPGS